MPKPDAHRGRVSLVGAGPGDAGLITVKGLRRLRGADAIVYDALANPLLLDEAKRGAQRIDVGKRGGETVTRTQDQINALLVDLARQGLRVVRLKGGDPLLFGRGAEEAACLAAHGIECEVIPGVTSGIAAPAAAGIAVTHRDLAGTVTFVTGHRRDEARDVDAEVLYKLIIEGGTVCFYMAVARWDAIARRLTGAGLPGDTPAAAVQWGTLPEQRAARATVATLGEVMEREGIGSPAVLVVGRVAGVEQPGLEGFMRRPLMGRRVLVTRARRQAAGLRDRLTELGAEVVEAPMIEFRPPGDWAGVDDFVRLARSFDWLVLSSPRAVWALSRRMRALGRDARGLSGVGVAVVGSATGASLRARLGVTADVVPARFTGEDLARELVERGVAGRRVAILQGDQARPGLAAALRAAGAEVTTAVAYRTVAVKSLPERALRMLEAGEIDWVTLASPSAAQSLVASLGDRSQILHKTKVASIGPVTSGAVRALGLAITAEAGDSTMEGLVTAILSAEAGGGA